MNGLVINRRGEKNNKKVFIVTKDPSLPKENP